MKNLFQHNAAQRVAAKLALFAILLILVAPLISMSLQHESMNGMHHDMSMSMHEHAAMDNPTQSTPVNHVEACGYCVLLAHVPGVFFLVVLLLVGRLLRRRVTPARQKKKLWHFFPWLWPDTRAPPPLCFS
ncbi:DUF2946 domain-containing protein [Salmonella enterica]